ncbi:IGR protein motif-domain-containing protein [Hypoxylon sp. FL1284]|nr:IGR protein motif-domain-containing protein [Hypoxylon sp. FL1284]
MVRIKPLFRPQQLRTALTPTAPRKPLHPSTLAAAAAKPAAIRALSSSSSAAAAAATPASNQPSSPGTSSAIPAPTPFVPDVQTFLRVIGRGLSQHASKFPSWEALFSLTSDQLRELGVEPPRTRRYLLQWRQRFRLGRFGVGGDLRHVDESGAARLAVLSVLESQTPDGDAKVDPARPRKLVVNVPPGRALADCSLDELARPRGFRVRGARTIVGPYALPLKEGQGATVTATEGMWEDRRGHKIDGGERRRTEIRYKKRIAERREMRERGEL